VRPSAALFGAIITLASPLAAQDQTTAWEAYEAGLSAQKRGDHRTAVAAFRRALELRSSPSARLLTYGNTFIEYFPLVRLAESQLALGDLDGAAATLGASARAKAEPASLREGLALRLKELQAARKTPPAAAPVPKPAPAAAPPVTRPEVAKPAPAPVKVDPIPTAKPPVPTPLPESKAPPPQTPAPRVAPVESPQPEVRQPEARPSPGPAEPLPQAPLPGEIPAPTPPRRSWQPLALGALAAAGLGGLAYLLLRKRKVRGRAGEGQSNQRTMALSAPLSLESLSRLNQLPANVGPYTLNWVLGHGGFATTYGGYRRSDAVAVALKIPHPHLLQDPEALNRFRQETALGSLLDHPTIVRLLDASPTTGVPWMAMELVEGETLHDFMTRSGPLELPQAIQFAHEIAQALAHAHGKGVVHRDLKPANVMVSKGHIKVMDFGIARILDSAGLTGTALFLGTPAYSAPESLKGSRVGPPADRYALGILIFEMLAGHPPFQAENPLAVMDMHRSAPLPDLATLRPEVPRRLVRLVERLMTKTPEDRPEDPEVLTILEELSNP
jgi:outer membrane biosynthesis protein TonB